MKYLVTFLMLFVMSGCGDEKKPLPVPVPTVTVTPKPSPKPTVTPSPTGTPVSVRDLFTASDAVHVEVDEYVASFIAEGKALGLDIAKMFKSGPKLKMQIGSLDQYGAGVIGLCSTGSGSRVLTLDPDFFNRSQGKQQNQLLVSHELGHCILYRPHRADVGIIPDQLAHRHEFSIMYPLIMGSLQYTTHKPYYDEELYTELSLDGEPQTYVCGE